MDKKLLVMAVLIIALMVTVISVEIIGKPHRPHPVPARKTDLNGRKVTVMTNHPHLRAADFAAEWFHEESGAIVRNIVVDYTEMLSYAIKDAYSDDPQLDVIMFWYVDVGCLAEKGVLRDLTGFIEKNRQILQPADFIFSLYDPYTLYKGKRWALPYDGDSHVLFYRKSLLQKYGFSPPETWDEFSVIARTVTEKERNNGIYGTAIMAQPAAMILVSSFVNRLGGFGGRMLDENSRPVINSDEAVAALSAMLEQSAYALPTPMETDWEVARDAFLSGKIAMADQWTDIGIMAEDPEQSVIRGDWGAVQMPKGSGEKARHSPALNSGFSLGVSAKAKDPEAAQAYLLFISRPDITMRLNLVNGGIDPVRISVLNSNEYKKFNPELSVAVRASLKSATAWPCIPQTHELLDILTLNIRLTLEGRKSPREALDDTQKQWTEIIG
ncbi:MAG: ABC transporter substrate-binding protein [Desulfococcaceae bacterium]